MRPSHTMHAVNAVLILIAALFTAPTAVRAQTGAAGGAGAESAGPCSASEFRQFDFWIGEWEVTNPAGQPAGRNTISVVAGGCGLLEQWRGAGGSTGTSLNMYDPQTGAWTQTWVGAGGSILRLSGGLEAGSMVLSGTRRTPQGEVLDRIRWTPREDGSVRQFWQVSTDGGQTWSVAFDGTYRRVDSRAAGG